MSTILNIKELEASYTNLKILKGIDLEVGEGDLVAIIGPNGCGKSTTLKCIFGLLDVERGKILFEGKNIADKSPDEIVKLGISYVPQGARVFRTLSVDENLEMGAFILDDRGLIEKRKNEIYKFFPALKEKSDQRATFLSGGQQQMLGVGRALMLKPKLLLLDEPSAGLAPNLTAELFAKIKKINDNGTTIILVEQNASMALAIANKAYVLESGKIAFHGDAKKIANSRIVRDLYLGH
jgi:branched-chain amino acid transport system ATP-binding protein